MTNTKRKAYDKIISLGKRKIKDIDGQYDLQQIKQLHLSGTSVMVHKFKSLNTIHIDIHFINTCLENIAKGMKLDSVSIEILKDIHTGIK